MKKAKRFGMLREIDTKAHMFFDLEEGTLTLFKDE
jgi:hypothetical protein